MKKTYVKEEVAGQSPFKYFIGPPTRNCGRNAVLLKKIEIRVHDYYQ